MKPIEALKTLEEVTDAYWESLRRVIDICPDIDLVSRIQSTYYDDLDSDHDHEEMLAQLRMRIRTNYMFCMVWAGQVRLALV